MSARSKLRPPSSPAAPSAGELGEPLYRFPTTVAQQSFWYLNRFEPGNPGSNMAVLFRSSGGLQPALLERSIHETVRRHEILRTTFARIDGVPAKIVHSAAKLPLPLDDLSQLDSAA